MQVGNLPEPRTRLVESEHDQATAGFELDAADVCICVGKGVGGPEALAEIEALAARLGAAVGASRDVADAGWLPKNRQIGLTGRAIAPRLLIEVGVRGAFEHMVGSVGRASSSRSTQTSELRSSSMPTSASSATGRRRCRRS